MMIERFGQDLAFAIRQLRRSPAFTALSVGTLALGIGATSAIFSVVDAVVLRPLPFPEPDRLVHISVTAPHGDDFPGAEANFLDFREQNRSLEEMAAFREATLTLTGEAEPERVPAFAVSRATFELVGGSPALGRTFTESEDRPGGEPVAILGHDLWQQRYGGDPGVVGRTITLDGQPHQVVGVMEPGFDFPGTELWVPLAADPGHDRDDHWLGMIGRLRPGVTVEQAASDLGAIARGIGEAHPEVAGWGVRVATFPEWLVGRQISRTAFVLLGAVGCLLLITCANLANLLLARATARHAELGLRAALGAGRSRIMRQLLTEAAVLGLLGAAAGFLVAIWAVEALRVLDPGGIPRLDEVAVDGRVLGFTIAVGLATSMIFGLAPARHGGQVDPGETLKQGGRGRVAGRHATRDALVVTQIALAVVLLVGAGLLIRSFVQLQGVDAGFEPANTHAVRLQLPAGHAEPRQNVAFMDELAERLSATPGVVSVGATSVDPFSDWNLVNSITPEERAAEAGSAGYMMAGWRVVTPRFFRTMEIPVLGGRGFTDADRADGTRTLVVTASLAERLWPGENPVGKRLFWGGVDGTPRTVIGVVGDYRDVQLDAEVPPLIFLPYQQLPWPDMTVVVRSSGGARGIAGAVRSVIREMDPDLPVPEVRPLDRALAGAVAAPRFRTLLVGFFSAVALLLAALGIYGVMSFSVAQRTREIAVKLALGAAPGELSLMVLRRAALLTVAGLGLGLPGALALSRSIEGLLFGTAPNDPVTFATVAALLAGVALLASYLPARAVTRVDPNTALRAE